MKPASPGDIYMISYEKPKPVDTKEQKDKAALVNKIGTKLANLVLFLKSSPDKSILFSQWDDMLRRTGEVLTAHGIKNVYCRGNVWSRDKAIRDFTQQEDVKVIMLSSESAAAGTNLTAATIVILLDPVSGSYEYRKNTEGQAIGRAHRTGQTKQVSVVRFIIKDTVEEEIYNENLVEDAKFKTDVKMTMLTDDNINLDTEEITKIKQEAEQKIKIKELKPKKKVKASTKKPVKKLHDTDDDTDIDSLSEVSEEDD
jgi:hypothetical protein